jgi:hypothetical protein
MKKSLDTTSMMNELKGQSAFFPTYKRENQPEAVKKIAPRPPKVKDKTPAQQKQVPAERYHDTMIPRNHDTTVSDNDNDIFEMARKAVKQVGKEAATHRFTLEEKNLLADIEYSYRRQGIRTSENEITRIAINYFAQEYRKNGENSLLAKILKLLNS